jgi:hypothetical protein
MKIRQGFVSNSSSTSFCIYGAIFEGDEILDLLHIEDEEPDYYETIDKIATELDLESGSADSEGDSFYIGKSWDGIKDDETGKQFKDSIENKIKGKFGNDIECSTHENSWYNG